MQRIWIYQADRFLNLEEQAKILERLTDFTSQWRAHGKKLTATAEIRYYLFIILMVDDAIEVPSGCSIDKSVYLLKDFEVELGVGFFNRLTIAYRASSESPIQLATTTEFQELIRLGKINENSLVFNNLVPSYTDLAERWEVPLNQSWHAKVFNRYGIS